MWSNLYEALYGKLSEDSELQELCGGRYYPDEVPREPTYPYIESVADKSMELWSTLGSVTEGARVEWTFKVHGRAPADVEQISARLVEMIHHEDFSISGYSVVRNKLMYQSGAWKGPEDEVVVWSQKSVFHLLLLREEE